MIFEDRLKSYTAQINEYLAFAIDRVKNDTRVFEAMRYSLMAGGKRIRPVLTLACCEALGGKAADALAFAASLEMVHTYSLIHDDLPAIDNDDLRRGAPTCHKAYGEAEAIFAGDALLSLAFEEVANAPLGDAQKAKMTALLAKASGILGMVGGQAYDKAAETDPPKTLDGLENIHRHKTGALICAACGAGAIAAGENERTFDEYADALGMAFQVRDDILDAVSTPEEMGKSLSDGENQKATFVALCGIKKAEEYLNRETDRAIRSVAPLGEAGRFLRDMANYLLERRN